MDALKAVAARRTIEEVIGCNFLRSRLVLLVTLILMLIQNNFVSE